jgi:hypothetical protein
MMPKTILWLRYEGIEAQLEEGDREDTEHEGRHSVALIGGLARSMRLS